MKITYFYAYNKFVLFKLFAAALCCCLIIFINIYFFASSNIHSMFVNGSTVSYELPYIQVKVPEGQLAIVFEAAGSDFEMLNNLAGLNRDITLANAPFSLTGTGTKFFSSFEFVNGIPFEYDAYIEHSISKADLVSNMIAAGHLALKEGSAVVVYKLSPQNGSAALDALSEAIGYYDNNGIQMVFVSEVD